MAAKFEVRWVILVFALLCQEEPPRLPRVEDARRTENGWSLH
jgi:hypothetical protein